MTFRAKPVVTPGRQRRESGERRNLYLNLAFGAVVIIAVLILAGAAAASWYADHWAAMASVNGQSISKDQYRAALAAYTWRLTEAESNFRDQGTRGLISSSEADQRIQQLQSQAQQLPDTALESMIDNELQRQIAAKDGVTVTDQQVEDQLKKEAQRPEYRESWVITIQPELSADATTPTEEQNRRRAPEGRPAAGRPQGRQGLDRGRQESSDSSASQGGAIGYLTADERCRQGLPRRDPRPPGEPDHRRSHALRWLVRHRTCHQHRGRQRGRAVRPEDPGRGRQPRRVQGNRPRRGHQAGPRGLCPEPHPRWRNPPATGPGDLPGGHRRPGRGER